MRGDHLKHDKIGRGEEKKIKQENTEDDDIKIFSTTLRLKVKCLIK